MRASIFPLGVGVRGAASLLSLARSTALSRWDAAVAEPCEVCKPAACSSLHSSSIRGRGRHTRHLLQAFSTDSNPSICNEGLPNDSVYHRFLYVIQVRPQLAWSQQILSASAKLARQPHRGFKAGLPAPAGCSS